MFAKIASIWRAYLKLVCDPITDEERADYDGW